MVSQTVQLAQTLSDIDTQTLNKEMTVTGKYVANNENRQAIFYCGTSNIVLPVPGKAHFPQEYKDKTRLTYYSTLFNSLEVNSTFYKLPMPATIEKWSNEVPVDFRFTFKLWRNITHAKELIYDLDDVTKFLDVVERIGQKKGCILVQFPASIKRSYLRKVRKLLDDLLQTGKLVEWDLAIEFRDNSWYCDEVYEMLELYNATIVTHDMPKSFTPLIDMKKTFIYLRFHGELGGYRGGYSHEILREHTTNIHDWLNEGLRVYAYFNNTIGEAVHNAITLETFVNKRYGM